jgi:hypothetical protein
MHYKGQASSSHHYAHATAFPIITYHDDDDDPSSSCLQKKFGLIWCQIPQDPSINQSPIPYTPISISMLLPCLLLPPAYN